MIGALLVVALSQTSPKVVQEPDKEVARSKTVVEFGDVYVNGHTVGPDYGLVISQPRAKFKLLIQKRQTMTDKLAQSTDNL